MIKNTFSILGDDEDDHDLRERGQWVVLKTVVVSCEELDLGSQMRTRGPCCQTSRGQGREAKWPAETMNVSKRQKPVKGGTEFTFGDTALHVGEHAEESLFRTKVGQRCAEREGAAVLDEEPGKRGWRPSARIVLPLFAFANYPVSSSHPTGVWTRPNMRAAKRKQPTRGEMFAKKEVDK